MAVLVTRGANPVDTYRSSECLVVETAPTLGPTVKYSPVSVDTAATVTYVVSARPPAKLLLVVPDALGGTGGGTDTNNPASDCTPGAGGTANSSERGFCSARP